MPVPYERTTSYVKGTAGGPDAILQASTQVELFDEELGEENYRAGIATCPAPSFEEDLSIEDCLGRIYDRVSELLALNKRIICLGGEHTITHPIVRAFSEQYSSLTVLQLDAHTDLRDEYEGMRFSHACVMARVRELVPVVAAGVRSISSEENDRIHEENLPVYPASFQMNTPGWHEVILEQLQNPVYISLDVDYFDPAIMPATGTPEPGGGLWYPTLEFLRKLFAAKEVAGFDVVELSPQKGLHSADFLAARLVYKMIGYWEHGMG